VQVQLIAAGSAAEAQAAWERLGKQRPDLVSGRSSRVFQADTNGHTVWRLRTGGFTDVADATTFCGQVRGAGGKCWVIAGGA
ncbi:MAG: SPOR domain-containing protein, partial [Acetobacteraceae bacterium]|nr:SPOR domain-containing protein [Acetobacteraceae bacterium]